MALNAGEVSVLVVIKNREIVRVEAAEGTEKKVTRLEPEERRAYSRSRYGLRPVERIYETDTEGPETCFMFIGGFKIEVPCA